MEVLILLVVFALYIVVRVSLGVAEDQIAKDRKRYAHGIAMVRRREYEEARYYFEAILHEAPRCALALAYRGKCHAAMGENYAALADFTRATSIDYRMVEAYLDKAKVLYELEEFENAMVEIEKACWHMRNSGEAFRIRGMLHLHFGHDDKARVDFKHAITLGDEDAQHMLQRLPQVQRGS